MDLHWVVLPNYWYRYWSYSYLYRIQLNQLKSVFSRFGLVWWKLYGMCQKLDFNNFRGLLQNAIMCCSVTLVFSIRYHVKDWQVLAIIIGSAMFFRGTNNTLVGIQDATIVSELIMHVVLVSGCVVLVMFLMIWRSRCVVTESVQSALEVEVKVDVSGITFYSIFLSSIPHDIKMPLES